MLAPAPGHKSGRLRAHFSHSRRPAGPPRRPENWIASTSAPGKSKHHAGPHRQLAGQVTLGAGASSSWLRRRPGTRQSRRAQIDRIQSAVAATSASSAPTEQFASLRFNSIQFNSCQFNSMASKWRARLEPASLGGANWRPRHVVWLLLAPLKLAQLCLISAPPGEVDRALPALPARCAPREPGKCINCAHFTTQLGEE